MLDINDKLPLLPSSFYDRVDRDVLRTFCHKAARYHLPTIETIDHLNHLLKPYDKADVLEIGAGAGDLGYHLGIRMTDNYCQVWPDVKTYYETLGQPIIQYGKDVERLDALEAVKKYKPKVVIGAWVTQWVDPNKPPDRKGSMYGIKEDQLIELVDMYILIGAEEIHNTKVILDKPHEKIDAPFVKSRRTDNKIWIWRRSEAK